MQRLITLVEVPPFERLASNCMTEDEMDAFKYFIASNPEAGFGFQGPEESARFGGRLATTASAVVSG